MKITIDGPAGSGKSTTARGLAKKLAALFIDTGAMYRAVTLVALERGILLMDSMKIERLSREILITFKEGKKGQRTIVNGIDRTEHVRSDEVEGGVSIVAANPKVRESMVAMQRKLASSHPFVVMEGRDAGSVVLPDADFKFFITADPAVRAMRRALEKKGKKKLDLKEVEEAIRKRDEMDSSRKASPLTIPEDATVIDNSKLTLDGTINKILELLV